MRALTGIKVVDFSYLIAGPLPGRLLANNGATVIKVESRARMEETRGFTPFKDNVPGVNRSAAFAVMNAGKYGITLNLRHPQGIEIAKKLAAWADVVIENFRPGVMDRLGLGYKQLRAVNPDVIMLSTSLEGQTGPEAQRPGIGATLEATAGFIHFIGWPDRAPSLISVAYTDYATVPIAMVAIMCALEHRLGTGRGQHIDMSQLEASLPYLAPAVLDYVATGQIWERQGNRCPCAAPHGAFRCRGDDSWCAIAVFTEEEWQGMCRAMGSPEWAKDKKFATLKDRKQNEEELEKLIEAWTAERTAEEVMGSMQQAGVAAGKVTRGDDLLRDPQLHHRGYFRTLKHPEIGYHYYESLPFRLSQIPSGPTRPGPCLGEHNEYVYTQILGLPDEEFVRLMGEGVFD